MSTILSKEEIVEEANKRFMGGFELIGDQKTYFAAKKDAFVEAAEWVMGKYAIQGEKALRWVKATERQPIEMGRFYFCKTSRKNGGLKENRTLYLTQSGFEHSELFDVIEWLDESGTKPSVKLNSPYTITVPEIKKENKLIIIHGGKEFEFPPSVQNGWIDKEKIEILKDGMNVILANSFNVHIVEDMAKKSLEILIPRP